MSAIRKTRTGLMRRRGRLALMCAAVLTSLVPIPPAAADAGTVSDVQDTHDVLDLASATHRHSPKGDAPRRLIHGIESWQPWSNEEFLSAELRIWLPDRDRRSDRSVLVLKNADNSLVAEVWGRRFIAYGRAWRPDNKTVQIEFPKSVLGTNTGAYRWKAFLSYPCSRDVNEQCEPLPPDTHPGRVRHTLR